MMTDSKPQPVFVYGTLLAMPLLAWVLTGDALNVSQVSHLAHPARVADFTRLQVKGSDYPAAIRQEDPAAAIQGFVLFLETASQRRKLDSYEGDAYKLVSVTAHLLDQDKHSQQETVKTDMYLWNGSRDLLSDESWCLDRFVSERLQDWIDLFEGMEILDT